jgi:hypothetical protein
MKRATVILAALTLVLGGVGQAKANPILDQSFIPPPQPNLIALIGSAFDLTGQIFTAGKTGTLSSVRVDVTGDPNAPPLRISIYAVANGFPTSTLLGSTTLATGTSQLSNLVNFGTTTIHIVAGNQYLITADYPSITRGLDEGEGYWSGLSSNAYPGGDLVGGSFIAGHSGQIAWISYPQYDVFFQTYLPSPEPSTLTLLGIGAAGLMGYGRRRLFTRRPAGR